MNKKLKLITLNVRYACQAIGLEWRNAQPVIPVPTVQTSAHSGE